MANNSFCPLLPWRSVDFMFCSCLVLFHFPAGLCALDHLPPLANKGSNRSNDRHPVFDPHFVYRWNVATSANSPGNVAPSFPSSSLHRFLFPADKWAREIQHGHFDPRRGEDLLGQNWTNSHGPRSRHPVVTYEQYLLVELHLTQFNSAKKSQYAEENWSR